MSDVFKPGIRIGPFHLVRLLNSGGMGQVWKAYQFFGEGERPQTVAIKIPRLSAVFNVPIIEGMRLEAEVLKGFKHPKIPSFIASGEYEGLYFIAIEFVPGVPLSELLGRLGQQGRRLPIELIRQILHDLADILDYVHNADIATIPQKIVHRDIAPKNMMIGRPGLRLIDFGVAAAAHSESSHHSAKGTLRYMAPEAIGGETSPALDIYGVGATLWEMLMGRLFRGRWTQKELGRVVIHGEYESLDPDIDPFLRGLCELMLQFDPAMRPTAAQIVAKLEDLDIPNRSRAMGEFVVGEFGRAANRSGATIEEAVTTEELSQTLAAARLRGTNPLEVFLQSGGQAGPTMGRAAAMGTTIRQAPAELLGQRHRIEPAHQPTHEPAGGPPPSTARMTEPPRLEAPVAASTHGATSGWSGGSGWLDPTDPMNGQPQLELPANLPGSPSAPGPAPIEPTPPPAVVELGVSTPWLSLHFDPTARLPRSAPEAEPPIEPTVILSKFLTAPDRGPGPVESATNANLRPEWSTASAMAMPDSTDADVMASRTHPSTEFATASRSPRLGWRLLLGLLAMVCIPAAVAATAHGVLVATDWRHRQPIAVTGGPSDVSPSDDLETPAIDPAVASRSVATAAASISGVTSTPPPNAEPHEQVLPRGDRTDHVDASIDVPAATATASSTVAPATASILREPTVRSDDRKEPPTPPPPKVTILLIKQFVDMAEVRVAGRTFSTRQQKETFSVRSGKKKRIQSRTTPNGDWIDNGFFDLDPGFDYDIYVFANGIQQRGRHPHAEKGKP